MAKKAVGYMRQRGEYSWELSYRRHTKTIRAKNERDAQKQLAKFVTDIDAGRFKADSKMNLQELAARFLRDNPNLSAETRDNYAFHLNKRILPALGHKKLDKITPSNILDFYANLQEDGIRDDGKPGGLSPATIHKYHHILSSMFSFAVQIQEMSGNPCQNIKPPRIPRRGKMSVDREPAIDMLKALQSEPLKYQTITIIAACTGMRRGEILGIGESKIDFEKHTFTIDRAARHSAGKVFFKEPKTSSSNRVIPFPASIVPILKKMIEQKNQQRESCGTLWVSEIEVFGNLEKNDLLFTAWNGAPMHPNTVDSWFKKFKQANGLPDSLKFHGLRHTNITLQLKSGVDVGTAADMVGHSNKSMTLAYEDSDVNALRSAAQKIDAALDLENVVFSLLKNSEKEG